MNDGHHAAEESWTIQTKDEEHQMGSGHIWALGALWELSERGLIRECVTMNYQPISTWDQLHASGCRASRDECVDVVLFLSGTGAIPTVEIALRTLVILLDFSRGKT